MNKVAKISMLAVGAAMVTQALQAQINDGDLVIGFTSASQSYVIDLGQVPTSANTQLAGAGGPINLSLYNSIFASGAPAVGVVGGDVDGVIDPSSGETIWTTTLRTGNAATAYGSAGTESAPGIITASAVDSAAQLAESVALGQTGSSTAQNSAWDQIIAISPGTGAGHNGTSNNNFATYANPMANLGTSVITLDLWSTTDDNSANHFSYVGDLQIDMSGATGAASVIFDPTAVPEPSTYALLGGGGLLALVFRRKAASKSV